QVDPIHRSHLAELLDEVDDRYLTTCHASHPLVFGAAQGTSNPEPGDVVHGPPAAALAAGKDPEDRHPCHYGDQRDDHDHRGDAAGGPGGAADLPSAPVVGVRPPDTHGWIKKPWMGSEKRRGGWATMAGSSGAVTPLWGATGGEAPGAAAASSYDRPIENNRPR